MSIKFSSSDQEKIQEKLAVFSNYSKYQISIEYLLHNWATFINDIQAGYKFSIYDYDNDLSVRGMLEEIIECLSKDGQERLLTVLTDLDQKFLNLTVAPANKSNNWWKRYPLNIDK